MTVEEMRGRIGKEDLVYDVIVAGGGPAGIGAALAAAQSGKRVLLLEARPYFGGVASTSLWMPMNRLKLNGGSRGGVHELLVSALEKKGPDAAREGKVTWTDGDGLHIHPDYLKMTLFELFEKYGVDYLLKSPVNRVETHTDGDGRTVIDAIIIKGKDRDRAYKGKIFIDCTGDGDLAFAAGAETETGDPETGRMMPVTLGFAIANCDTDRVFEFYDGPDVDRIMKEFREEGQKRGLCMAPWYSFDRTTVPGLVSCNNGGLIGIGTLNCLTPEDATLAERVGMQIAMDFIGLAREFGLPGFENCYLDRTGAAVGVRETRRVKCEYVLVLSDALEGADFEDTIARRYGAIDQAGSGGDKSDIKMKSGYGYPYRALIVCGIGNLLAAGRCGSYTHQALAAGKSMGNMMAIGQAAGVAAALAVEKGITVRDVDAAWIREILEARNVTL